MISPGPRGGFTPHAVEFREKLRARARADTGFFDKCFGFAGEVAPVGDNNIVPGERVCEYCNPCVNRVTLMYPSPSGSMRWMITAASADLNTGIRLSKWRPIRLRSGVAHRFAGGEEGGSKLFVARELNPML